MIKVRAEQNALLIWNLEYARTAFVSREELTALKQWTNGKSSGFAKRLINHHIIDTASMPLIKAAIVEAASKKAPPHSFCSPESLHIELTSRCPLNCVGCYKSLGETDLSFNLLLDTLRQANEMNVFQIALGGGEPLAYPDLIACIKQINKYGMAATITTSGFGLSKDLLHELILAGLKHIQISLNGSCKEIHSISRDGYEYAIDALSLLKDSRVSYGINWVARMDNVDDLPNLMQTALAYHASNINILRYKPSSKEDFGSISLTAEKLLLLERIIRSTKGVSIKVDSAFSNLRCHINGQTSFFSGCGAGRRFLALDAEGFYRPCSHIDMKEKSDSLHNTWYNSPNLKQFRAIGDKIGEPCRSCEYLTGCFGCRAIVCAKGNDFFAGDETCICMC